MVHGNDMQIVDTTISGNSVNTYIGHGGGIVCGGGEIINTTISGNEVSGGWIGSGGGIYKSGGNLTIQGSTISGNGIYTVEKAFGGGIDNSAREFQRLEIGLALFSSASFLSWSVISRRLIWIW